MGSVNLEECYDLAVKLAKEAGAIIKSATTEKKNIQKKGSIVDFVTETDKNVEEFLKKGFISQFPDHCFIGEESSNNDLTDSPTWIIDPVDGTLNFIHTFPNSCVSIGFAVKKDIVLGVVYNPLLDKLFTGVKGKGSFCNGQKLNVSNVKELSGALVLIEHGSDRKPEKVEQTFTNMRFVIDNAHGVRSMGSAALNMCAVASGNADIYFEYGIHCWDMAAGKIIVEEAGGFVIDPEGGEFDVMGRRILCGSSRDMIETLSKGLKHIQYPRDGQ